MKITNYKIDDLIPYHNNPRINDGAVTFDIYGIINKKNGKIYVGQTKQGYRKRFIQHLCPKDGSPLLKRSVAKYGRENFECELLDVCYQREVADEKEMMWIKTLKTYMPKYGYNLSMGGTFGDFNQETLKKMSESKKGEKNSFYGKKHTKEAKDKMSKFKKNTYILEDHPGSKSILCVETQKTYNCVKRAEMETGISAKHIGQVANKRYGRKTAGNFHWEWA